MSELELISRAEAISRGFSCYFTGRPCKYGHISKRFCSTKNCMECVYSRNKKWREENPEKNAKRLLDWRLKNVDKLSNYRREYYDKNADRKREYALRYHYENRDKQLKKMADWAAKNKDKIYAKNAKRYRENREEERRSYDEWRRANPDKVNALVSARRARKLNATPPWLSADHKREILGFYKLSQKISRETGVRHHVDHIIPLKGKFVSGLHVPWNLQVIPATQNIKKGNKVYD